MSKQLAISSAISIMAMACLVLYGPGAAGNADKGQADFSLPLVHFPPPTSIRTLLPM